MTITIAEQTAVQQIQAYADDMIERAHRHHDGPFRIGVPRCLWRRAQLPARASITTRDGHRARLTPVDGFEFQTFADPWDEITERVAQELEAMQ